MTTVKETSKAAGDSKASAGQPVRENLFAAEACFLADELRARGLECAVRATGDGPDCRENSFEVVVASESFSRASELAEELLTETDDDTRNETSSVPDKWGEASLAGGLGLLLGLRLGARFKQPLMAGGMALLIGGFAFGATLFFRRKKA